MNLNALFTPDIIPSFGERICPGWRMPAVW